MFERSKIIKEKLNTLVALFDSGSRKIASKMLNFQAFLALKKLFVAISSKTSKLTSRKNTIK